MAAKKVVTLGEIMLRLSTPGFSRFIQTDSFNATFGGGEANVAISLAAFGFETTHVTRFPDHEIGYAATQLLRKFGVNTNHILYGGERIGIYYLETGASLRPSKVVYDRFHSSFSEIQIGMVNWDAVFDGVDWFHFTGITPALSQSAAEVCKEATQAAKAKGITISSDVNYRKNLWQYGKEPAEVMTDLVKDCTMIFASKGDMRDLFGLELTLEDKFFHAAQKTMEKFPNLTKIVNSKRDSNSASDNSISGMIFNGAETLVESPKYKIAPIIDRIGGGDAFAAGLIYGMLTYADDQKAIEFAAAAGALKHTIEGDANLSTVAEVEAILRGETTGKISR